MSRSVSREGCQGPWVCFRVPGIFSCVFLAGFLHLSLVFAPLIYLEFISLWMKVKGKGLFLPCLSSYSVVYVVAFFSSLWCFAACQASWPASTHCPVTCPSLCHHLLVLSTVVKKKITFLKLVWSILVSCVFIQLLGTDHKFLQAIMCYIYFLLNNTGWFLRSLLSILM